DTLKAYLLSPGAVRMAERDAGEEGGSGGVGANPGFGANEPASGPDATMSVRFTPRQRRLAAGKELWLVVSNGKAAAFDAADGRKLFSFPPPLAVTHVSCAEHTAPPAGGAPVDAR
ncbi:MAG: hypothetical protein KGL53_12610, partial [Elusimicrobia bacterium]|nr:hypothetical protein [Elusimicrobiota bacterium]